MEMEKLFMNTGNPPPLSYAASSSSPPTTWHSSTSAMELPVGEMNGSSEQLPNWENSMDQSVAFESVLSSIVSSPAASNTGVAVPTDSVVIRELIGRLGSICNSGEISPHSQPMGGSTVTASYIGGNGSTNTSCYGTPLDSPPKLNLSMMDHQEDEDPNAKRSKPAEANAKEKDASMAKLEANGDTNSAGDGDQKQTKDNSKPPEPPKDYIHVRARRGQATGSHSLAERVRREKISERMKFLQDLVPGCNKVTGKAVMLDEIINYVQSLQRQVEVDWNHDLTEI